MNLIANVLFAALTLAAQAAPDASMMQPVQRWIAAYNAGAAPLPEDIFADDAVVTDEFPPFVWVGKTGEHAWASAIDAFIRPGRQHVSVGAAQSFQSTRDGTRVSFVLPATLTFTSSRTGGRITEHALGSSCSSEARQSGRSPQIRGRAMPGRVPCLCTCVKKTACCWLTRA
jgi:hypothetical protein